MATISNTPRPGYVWDATDNVWYPIGVGGHGHSDYITQATAVNPTIIDAKGDILTATAADTPARLAVGNNGETLVADSSTATGLSYQENYAAGKNKILNGDFNINQRAFSSITASAMTFDRWLAALADGTSTLTAQTFTLGAAPVAGYESTNFLRLASTGQTATSARTSIEQRIESVKTFAGQTVTVSFWAKAASGTPSITPELSQQFGSGGSAFVSGIGATKIPITTSWARYTLTIAVPSIAGKTIGTVNNNNELRLTFWTSAGSDFNSRSASLGIQTTTIDIWGVQVEDGTVATAFNTATGTLQGELAACQRYYYRSGSSSSSRPIGFHLYGQGSTSGQAVGTPKVTMRVAPTSLEFSSLKSDDPGDASYAITAFTLGNCTDNAFQCDWSVASGSANSGNYILQTNTGGGYLAFSAEL